MKKAAGKKGIGFTPTEEDATSKNTKYVEILKAKPIKDNAGWSVRPENKKIFGDKGR